MAAEQRWYALRTAAMRLKPSRKLREYQVASTGPFLVDLDAAIAAAGINYTSDFRIKFQQYGNRPAPNNGREWDDILVELL